MDTVDLHDAYTVRSLDDLAKIYANEPGTKNVRRYTPNNGQLASLGVSVRGTQHAAVTLDAQVRR